jgi:nitroreductase
VELTQAIRSRRMVRSFTAEPLDPVLVEGLVADALRAPTAGNTRGVAWLVLEGAQTALYWERTTTPDWRRRSPRFAGLSRAPVIALALCSPNAYVTRYGETDKLGSGLGPVELGEGGEAAWPVPYWFGDAAFSTMLLLLGAHGAGIGAAFLGSFRGEEDLLGALEVPADWRLFGAVLLGHPDGRDTPSRSLKRWPAPGAGRLHWGRWVSGP